MTVILYNIADECCIVSQALGVYSISKTALLALAKVLANELGSDGIRVNCILPGLIKTNFSKAVKHLRFWFSKIG